MKKTVLKEVTICDLCEVQETGYATCSGCGKYVCYDCQRVCHEYQDGRYSSSSASGLYCPDCDARLMASGDMLHAAYRRLAMLRDHEKAVREDLERRFDEAEKAVKAEYAKRNPKL